VYWELVPLEGTPRWKSFIGNARRVGLPVILFVQISRRVGLAVKCMRKLRMWTWGKVVKKGNNKRKKKRILRVSRDLEVLLSVVLLMREKEIQR
jgi:hypothetical protein